jgi:AcrR family transcriptional regulator
MARLAKDAGVSRATLYRRFSNRDAVVEALARTGDAPASLRSRVLDALERVVLRTGPTRFTMEDVAAEAGCGVATLYRRFGSREQLLTALAEARTPLGLLDELRYETSVSLREVLEAVVREALAHLDRHRALLPLALNPDPDAEALTAHLRELEGDGRAKLASLLARRVAAGELDGDPLWLADALVGMIAARALGRSEAREPHDEAVHIVDLYLDGCAVRTEAP